MRKMKFTFPYPPTLNTLYATFRGRRIKSSAGKKYEKDVGKIVLMTADTERLLGSVFVEILVYPPDNRRRDLDNIVKIIFDSLGKANVFSDDSQIDHFTVIRKNKAKHGYVKVLVQEINERGFEQ